MNRKLIVAYFKHLAEIHESIRHQDPSPSTGSKGIKRFFRTSLEELLAGTRIEIGDPNHGYFMMLADVSFRVVSAAKKRAKVSVVFFILKSVASGDADGIELALDESNEISEEILNRISKDDRDAPSPEESIFRKSMLDITDVPVLQARLNMGTSIYHGAQVNLSWLGSYYSCYEPSKFIS